MRFIGALTLDASAYEDVEADRRAGMQAVLVVVAATAAGGIASVGLGASPLGFVAGAVMALGGWLMWVSMILTVGTTTLAQPQTRSSGQELLRTLGFAAAPGVFVAFAAMRAVAPFVFAVVSIWMIATAVLAVRQSLDFRSTPRAIAVCAITWVLTIGFVFLIATLFGPTVS